MPDSDDTVPVNPSRSQTIYAHHSPRTMADPQKTIIPKIIQIYEDVGPALRSSRYGREGGMRVLKDQDSRTLRRESGEKRARKKLKGP